MANPEIAVRVANDRGPEEFGPVGRRDRQWGDHNCADAIGASLGYEAVKEGSRREREEDFAVGTATTRRSQSLTAKASSASALASA